MPNKDGSETEQEYHQRIQSVPGIFSDRNESAETVVNRPAVNLASAQELEKKTALAPTVHPEEDRPEVEVPQRSMAHVEATQVPGYQPQQAGTEVPVEDPKDAHEEQSSGLFPVPNESSTNAKFPVANKDGTLETFHTDEKGETDSKIIKPDDNPAFDDQSESEDASNKDEEKAEDPQVEDEEQTQDPAESKASEKVDEIESKDAEEEEPLY